MPIRTCSFVIVVLAGVLLAAPAAGQSNGIAGVVRDAQGAVIPGVTVEVSSPALIEKVRTAVTDGQGLYQVPDLRPGTYAVTFSLTGFQTVRREGIDVAGSFTATINAQLAIAAVEETLVVTGQSPIVDTRNVVQQQVLREEVRNSIPGARQINTMAQLIPGVSGFSTDGTRSAQDVGGIGGERALLMIHGSRAGDNTIQFDGITMNNPSLDGGYQTFTFNPGEAQEYVIETGSISADTQTGGVRANVIAKDGGNRFSVNFLGSYTNGDLQSTNLDDELRARGAANTNELKSVYDWNVSVGGPMKRDRLWFYSSYRYWGNRQTVAGTFFPVDPLANKYVDDLSRPAESYSWLKSYSVRLTLQATARNKFGLYVSHQPREKATTSTFVRNPVKTNRNIHVGWKSLVSSKLSIDTAVSTPSAVFGSDYIVPGFPGPDVVQVTDLGIGKTWRTLPDNLIWRLSWPGAAASVTYVTGTHLFKVGVQFESGRQIRENKRNRGMTYTFLNGVPRSITEFITPYNDDQRFARRAAYLQDQWVLKRVTLNLGVRLDADMQWIPEQQSGPGPFSPLQTWPEIKNLANWKDLSPRLGGVFDVFGNGRTAVKASISRYVVRDAVSFAISNNPLLLNASATRSWNDNGDFEPQENELGTLSNRNFGTVVTSIRPDEAIRHGWFVRPNNWETAIGVQQEIRAGVSANVGFIRRSFGNFFVTRNLAVSPSNYDPYCITAPVDPRLPGGGGGQICGLYDLNPSKLGQVDLLRTSADNFGDQSETFNGVDATVNLRLPQGIRVSGGLAVGTTSTSAGQSVVNSTNTCFVVNSPQELRFCNNHIPWGPDVKLLAIVPLPGGIETAATFQSRRGLQILADYSVSSAQVQGLGRNLSSGVATVPLIQPGTLFGDSLYQLDLRFGKVFHAKGKRVRTSIELNNALNANPVLDYNSTYGSQWLRPLYVLPGRLIKPTLTVDF